MLVIAPWNYPYLTAVDTIVPALIAGNAVILKHAAQTILVGDRLQAAMDKAGLPVGLFQHMVIGSSRMDSSRPLPIFPRTSLTSWRSMTTRSSRA